MSDSIYLDYNATAPFRPGVKEFYINLLDLPGNASSVHKYGREARKHIETARAQIAKLVNTKPENITFNSGATEANNTVLNAYKGEGIIISAGEHPSVTQSTIENDYIRLTEDGILDPNHFEEILARTPPPALISVMTVNNETGVIQPIDDLIEICHMRGIKVHTDATQAIGRMPVDLGKSPADYTSFSSHKIGGPQGVGVLIPHEADRAPPPLIHGGGQEGYRRAGTENFAAIAAFGAAAEHARTHLEDYQQLVFLRNKLEDGLKEIAHDAIIFGERVKRVPNTTCCAIPGISAETVLIALDLEHIAISSGSACSSGKIARSHVLQAMGVDEDLMSSALRISTGWGTEEQHIDRLLNAMETIIKRVRS